MASTLLAAAIYNLDKLIDRFQEQGIILKEGRRQEIISLYTVLNVIGVFLLILAIHTETMAILTWIFLGLFIKGLVVPILGILLFYQLRGMFIEMKLRN